MEIKMPLNRFDKRAFMKAAILAAFIVLAIALVRFTPIKGFLTIDRLGRFLETAGAWAPIVFMAIYAIGICLFVPGTALGAIGAVLFGPYWGFVYVWVGAQIGATGAFLIGRYLGRDFAAALIGDKLRNYDDAIERNGFATVLYMRLFYFPFTPMNFGMGLTKVRFLDYFLGTGIGIIVGTFIFIFFIGTLKEVWTSGNWDGLLSPKALFSMALFSFSLFIPKIINRFKKERTYIQK
jgi:uncharacterized membrane protein YdjX (TVP38/TMEM64 family)